MMVMVCTAAVEIHSCKYNANLKGVKNVSMESNRNTTGIYTCKRPVRYAASTAMQREQLGDEGASPSDRRN